MMAAGLDCRSLRTSTEVRLVALVLIMLFGSCLARFLRALERVWEGTVAVVEVRCTVKLAEPIVLATQQDTSYPPLRWDLPNGDKTTVEMEVPVDKIKGHQDPSKLDWYY
jgi:hypothetical protein